MKRTNFDIKELTNSESPIVLHPTWDYSERVIDHRDYYLGQEGQLNSFRKVGSYQEFFLPIDYIGCLDATVINSLWITQSNIEFVYNRGESDETSLNVKITNSSIPFNQRIQGSFCNYSGSLIMRTY